MNCSDFNIYIIMYIYLLSHKISIYEKLRSLQRKFVNNAHKGTQYPRCTGLLYTWNVSVCFSRCTISYYKYWGIASQLVTRLLKKRDKTWSHRCKMAHGRGGLPQWVVLSSLANSHRIIDVLSSLANSHRIRNIFVLEIHVWSWQCNDPIPSYSKKLLAVNAWRMWSRDFDLHKRLNSSSTQYCGRDNSIIVPH